VEAFLHWDKILTIIHHACGLTGIIFIPFSLSSLKAEYPIFGIARTLQPKQWAVNQEIH